MTDEQLATVLNIMEKVRAKYSYDIYDGDDMAQEAFLIAQQATKKYVATHGDYENYIWVSIRNRLRNFIRDNQTSVYQPEIPLEYTLTYESSFDLIEIESDIKDKLTNDFRKMYLKYKAGAYLTPGHKRALLTEIRRLTNE